MNQSIYSTLFIDLLSKIVRYYYCWEIFNLIKSLHRGFSSTKLSQVNLLSVVHDPDLDMQLLLTMRLVPDS